MRHRRAVAAAVLAGALAAPFALPSAQAADTGAGSSGGGTEAIRVTLGGGLLDLRLLTELSETTTEGSPRAAERVVPLSVSSSLLPQLGTISLPPVEVSSTGPEQSQSAPGADLGSLLGGSPVPALLGGVIDPTSLRAVVDTAGALAAAAGGASDLSVLGGLVRLGDVVANLGSAARGGDAGSSRGLSIDSVEVLDLQALLGLLGLSPTDLPLDVAAGLVDRLGLPLPLDLASPGALVDTVQGLLDRAGSLPAQLATLQQQAGIVTALTSQIDALTSQLSAATAALAPLQQRLDQLLPLESVCSPLSPILALLGIDCDDVPATISGLRSRSRHSTSPRCRAS